MKIEHTRTHGFDGGPAGITWWTLAHNGNQYVVKRKTNNSGHKDDYEFIIDDHRGLDFQKIVKVKITPSTAIISADECNFIDITLAVQACMFIEKELNGDE